MKDPTEFRKRFAAWKNGKMPYKAGIPYDDNNHNTQYDYARATELGYTTDSTGHYPTRDYETGRYLKSPAHPTIMKSIVSDLGVGYNPYYSGGQMWSDTWIKPLLDEVDTPYKPEYKGGKLPKYGGGTEEGLVDGGMLPEVVVVGNIHKQYNKLADNERRRQREMAMSYLKEAPSISNIYNAANSFIKSLPLIGISGPDIDPYVQTGVAPAVGIKMPAPVHEMAKIESQVFPRMFKGLSADRYQKAVNIVKAQTIPKTYTKYEKGGIPGHPNADGIYNPVTKQISLETEDAFGHEVRHAIDAEWPLDKSEIALLRKAYNDDFIDYDGTINPLLMSKEMVTTNFDIRKFLLDEAGLTNAPLHRQNEFLAGLNMLQVRNAMLRANDYSKEYIKKLSTTPKYTDNGWNKYVEVLRNIKQAMQEVGSVLLPIGATATATQLYNTRNEPRNK